MKLVSGSRPFGWPSPLALDILAALSLTLLGFLVFVPELVLGLKVVDGDLYRQVIPTTAWYKAAISSDRESFWTSGMLGGFPIAFTQYGLLSPLDWAASKVLDPDRAFALTLALHLPLAGIATYCYARVTGLSRLPSLLAGVGYQFSTEALALGLSGYILRSLFLLPTLLLSVELVARRGFRWAILAAVAVGAALISGTAYIVAIAMLNGGIYTVACGFCMWRKGAREQALRLLVAVGCAVSLGVGLAAIRVLPTLSVTAESVRSNGLAFDVAAAGSPSLGTVVAAYLLPLTRLEGVGDGVAPSYVGPIVLTLAMVAALGARRNFLRGVLVGLLLFNLLASLGRNGLLFGVLHQLPLFNAFRNVSRFSVFSAFFLSMLAAQLLEDSRGPLAFRGRTRLGIKVAAFLTTVGFGVVILAGCLWLYGGDAGSWLRAIMEEHNLGPLNPLRPRLFLALAAIPATLWLFHAFLTGRVSRAAFQFCSLGGTALLLLTVGLAMMQFRALDPTSPATARFLQGDSTLFHLMSYAPTISYYHYMSYLSQGNPNPVRPESPLGQDFRYRYMREALAPNFPLEFGLEAIDGYEVLQSTRQAIAMTYLGSDKAEEIDVDHIALQDTRELEARLGRIGGLSMLDRMRVFRAFNVKYLLTNLQLWQNTNELRLAFTSPIPMLNPRTMTEVYVYEVVDALPRAYLVPDSGVVDNEIVALDSILSGKVTPSTTVLLEQPVGDSLQGPKLDPAQSTVDITSHADSQLTLHVRTTGSGYLIVNDAYYPGWRAWVDGVETPVLAANGWVRAVPVNSAGQHTVRMGYTPPLLKEGGWISIGSLLLCAVVVLSGLIQRSSKAAGSS